ncbi:hypothetical protein [Chloroflexus sp.]|uniref:hypothetical protein n=1 Tax=Chloroflexus sp. TaxID=1904827 RepID=UPI002ACED468|nr:hypothetical protein [Chloroflexus sp.]
MVNVYRRGRGGRRGGQEVGRWPRWLRCRGEVFTASLVITSPPYPNRMSYIRELRPYMYWLGYLNNGRDAGELD